MLVAIPWVELGIAASAAAILALIFWLIRRPSYDEAVEERKEVAESKIACPTCGELFMSDADLEAHASQHHSQTP